MKMLKMIPVMFISLSSVLAFANSPVVRCEFRAFGYQTQNFDLTGSFRDNDIATESEVSFTPGPDFNAFGVVVVFSRSESPTSIVPTDFELQLWDTGSTGTDVRTISAQKFSLPAGYPIQSSVEGISRQGVKLRANCRSL